MMKPYRIEVWDESKAQWVRLAEEFQTRSQASKWLDARSMSGRVVRVK
jgi:hypothetical protein